MNMKEAVISVVFKKYATFNGRASRSEYWWFTLASILASYCAMVLDNILGIFYDIQSADGYINGIFGLVLLIPSIAVSVRRLHDRGRSGWWLLIAITIIGLIPLFYWAVMPAKDGEGGKCNLSQKVRPTDIDVVNQSSTKSNSYIEYKKHMARLDSAVKWFMLFIKGNAVGVVNMILLSALVLVGIEIKGIAEDTYSEVSNASLYAKRAHSEIKNARSDARKAERDARFERIFND